MPSEALKKIEERHRTYQRLASSPAVAVHDDVVKLARALSAATSALRSYQYGNSSAELAEEVADASERVLAVVAGEVPDAE